MNHWAYLLVDFLCILVPLVASFYPPRAFYKTWRAFFLANAIVGLGFLIWDYFFTEWGVWGFNDHYLIGLRVANLPIEEILFFVCIPYACVFTFFAFRYLIKKNPLRNSHRIISIAFLIAALIIGLMNLDKYYTSWTFILNAVYLTYVIVSKRDMSFHYLAYLAIVPFFFLSNGILTGSFIEDQIVWYNDMENLGLRMFTIPVEDIFYGFLLITLNIDLYTYFAAKWKMEV